MWEWNIHLPVWSEKRISGTTSARLGYAHVDTRATEATSPRGSGKQQVWRLAVGVWASSNACEIWRAQT
jgi:hypothetical protein